MDNAFNEAGNVYVLTRKVTDLKITRYYQYVSSDSNNSKNHFESQNQFFAEILTNHDGTTHF